MIPIMTHTALLIASILTFAIGAVHSWLGERRLIGPLLAPERRQGILAGSFGRQILRFAWHLTTIAWWGIGAILAALTLSPMDSQGRLVAAVIGATFFATGAVILVASRGRHLAWPVFLAIAGLSIAPLLQGSQ
jgi:hypothetical protein